MIEDNDVVMKDVGCWFWEQGISKEVGGESK